MEAGCVWSNARGETRSGVPEQKQSTDPGCGAET